MGKIALLGDPHAKISDKHEVEAVIRYIISLKRQHIIDDLVILGDLFDTHAIVRLEVWFFWKEMFALLAEAFKGSSVDVIMGNHDVPGSKELSSISSIGTFKDIFPSINFVEFAPLKRNNILFVPFKFEEDIFVEFCNKNKDCHTVICHQTFNGAKYDNGMYAPDGFDPSKIPQKNIISGHIHTYSEFGKVFYPGVARWTSATDAGKQKGIWVVEFQGDGYSKQFYSTENIVTPMLYTEIREGDDLPCLSEKAKHLVHLIGSSQWVTKTKKKLPGHKTKTTYTDSFKKRLETRKNTTFEEFIKESSAQVEKSDILSLVKGL